MEHMRQAVATIEEPNGHLRYMPLPYYIDQGADPEVIKAMVKLANCMASFAVGIILSIEWEEEL